jgi:uncharacterized protein (DUF433 family)/DNA-binding transcriptional MerR regulator
VLDVNQLRTGEREQLTQALCSTRGRYPAERASQLSGVPRTTVYYWAREALLVPDHYSMRPHYWSYRDLVLLRMFAWLRGRDMSPGKASARIAQVRRELDLAQFPPHGHVRSDGNIFLVGDSHIDAITGEQLFQSLVPLVLAFDLLMPVMEGNRRAQRLTGPNLIRPSAHTAISPWVMGGEPCIRESRIPSASIFALTEDRRLEPADIIRLYPSLTTADVIDAVHFERSLRHHQLAA